MELVKDRQCGECLACCKVPTIRSDAFNKAPGILCQHYRFGAGCGIYETRPHPCRDFFCGWRVLEQLDEAWRPDRCGIMLTFSNDDIPTRYTKRPGMVVILGAPLAKIAWQPLLGFIGALISSETPVSISLPGPDGHAAVKSFLNDSLAAPVAARDYGTTLSELMRHIDYCRSAPKPPVTFD